MFLKWVLLMGLQIPIANAAPSNHLRSANCTELLTERFYTVYGHTIPLHLLEEVPENELQNIEATGKAMAEFFKKLYLEGPPQTDTSSGLITSGTRRGVHPKSHGSLRGRMTINSNIEPHDQVGIFKHPGKTYDVVARFSNGNPRPNSNDNGADSRGFGLKVLGVEGEPLLKDVVGAEVGTQEFTMNSSDTFFADNAETYRRFMEIGLLETEDFAEAAKNHVIEVAKSLNPLLAFRIFNAFRKIQKVNATNPLAINYFSIAPFQHGAGSAAPIVKHALMPCEGTWIEDADRSNPNFLRANLIRHISTKPACFRFMVQDLAGGYDIEDLTVPWDETRSPYRELARIEFPIQDLVDEAEAEKWVINPWNTLPEHKPVGGINRMRLAAYLLSIEMREKTKIKRAD